jgi:hypothetical protein
MISVIFCTRERTTLDFPHQIRGSKGYCRRITSKDPVSRFSSWLGDQQCTVICSWLTTNVMWARLAQVPAIIFQQQGLGGSKN